jgi:hypothetical protein
MIDIKVRYQAAAFMPGIEANQSNISRMMDLFADIGLIPTTFYETSTSVPQLSSVVILKEMPKDTLNAIYLKLFNPIKIYSDNKPFEWVSRTSSRIRKQINSSEEIFNFNSEINRNSVQLSFNQGIIRIA